MLLWQLNLGGSVPPPVTGTLLTASQIAAAKTAIATTLVTSAAVYRLGILVATLPCRLNTSHRFSVTTNSTIGARFNWVFRFAAGANVLKGDVIYIGTARYLVKDVDGNYPDGLSLLVLAEQTAY